MRKKLLDEILKKKIVKLNLQLLQILKMEMVVFLRKINLLIKILNNIKIKLFLNLIKKRMV